jgi:subtilase family serine protease
MTTTSLHRSRAIVCALLASLTTLSALALAPQRRIPDVIDNSTRVTLPGSRPARAAASADIGRVPASTPLTGITLVFSMTPAQKADLDTLIAAQQNPGSPSYHQWLTPDQFGARFGLADADLAAATTWLEQQGFTVDPIPASRNRISFSGTEAQVEAAFGTQLHYYSAAGESTPRFAPASDLTLPSGLAGSVVAVSHLSSFRARSHVIHKAPQSAVPDFTSSQTGSHFLAPADIATIYDITAAYNSGYNGTGQSIVVAGQSAIVATDISNFQTAAGLTLKAPTITLMPGTGVSTVYGDDESESDLDLEWAGAIAPGAAINFIYTGASPNFGVFDALTYAVTNNLAPIITVSYGECEASIGTAVGNDFATIEPVLAQAATQGQTVINSSGDDGSTSCSGQTGVTTAVAQSLSVSYPASSAYITAMGGTEFSAANVASTNATYFTAASGTDLLSSAKSYIPEQVWNDDSTTSGLSAGGGGSSILVARPAWQTGVSGIATGFYRLVPDISLDASPNNAGFLYCSSDSTGTGNIVGSCSHGFRDTSSTNLTVAGGTSFDAPIFAGMVAMINQSLGGGRQGLLNPVLYTLAANASTYASAFHDITTGSNDCLAGGTTCGYGASVLLYPATTGYDEATGLGSVDFNNLLKAWPTAKATTTRGAFTLAATAATVASGATGTSTVTITPTGGYTGTIAWSVTASPALASACYTIGNATVTGATAVTATLNISATSSNCAAAAKIPTTGTIASIHTPQQPTPSHQLPLEAAMAGLLAAGFFTRRSRKLRGILGLAILCLAGITLTGCSNTYNATTTTPVTPTPTIPVTNATKGTYTLTVTGTDTLTTTIKASTTLTLTID